MANLTVTLNQDSYNEMLEEFPHETAPMQDGYDALLHLLANASIQAKMNLFLASVMDENGNLRKKYSAMVGARWFDADGNLVLGTTNGDVLTLIKGY